MDEMTEKMLAISTIDDPVETRQLYLDMEASLPISVCVAGSSIKALQQQLSYLEITKNKFFVIKKIIYLGDQGGILCNISSPEDNQQAMISITHLKVDLDHPLADRINFYQKKRTLTLAIANIGTRRAAAKPKRKKRGFGS